MAVNMCVVEAAIAPVGDDYKQVTDRNHRHFQTFGYTVGEAKSGAKDQGQPGQHTYKDTGAAVFEIAWDYGSQAKEHDPTGQQIVHIVVPEPI